MPLAGHVPRAFVEAVDDTIKLAEQGQRLGLKGCCFAVRYGKACVGMLLTGEAIEDARDPDELKGKRYDRLIGFVIDETYRGMGIGSTALESAIRRMHDVFGYAPLLAECHRENKRALAFYLHHGFVNTGLTENEDVYLISK